MIICNSRHNVTQIDALHIFLFQDGGVWKGLNEGLDLLGAHGAGYLGVTDLKTSGIREIITNVKSFAWSMPVIWYHIIWCYSFLFLSLSFSLIPAIYLILSLSVFSFFSRPSSLYLSLYFSFFYICTGCSLIIAFFPKIFKFSELWPFSVFPRRQCVYTH